MIGENKLLRKQLEVFLATGEDVYIRTKDRMNWGGRIIEMDDTHFLIADRNGDKLISFDNVDHLEPLKEKGPPR